jgi:hypothetical protein
MFFSIVIKISILFQIQYMKKLNIVLAFLFFYISASAQEVDIGYRTTDVGAEFLNYTDGNFFGLHLGFNAKLHHSFHTSLGYYVAGDKTPPNYYNKSKGGLGVNLGYRYYVKPRPDGFFVGAKVNLFTNKVILTTQTPLGPYTSSILIPALQTGYMFLINDMFFITPSIEAGIKTNLQQKINAAKNKSVFLAGISCGFKI